MAAMPADFLQAELTVPQRAARVVLGGYPKRQRQITTHQRTIRDSVACCHLLHAVAQ